MQLLLFLAGRVASSGRLQAGRPNQPHRHLRDDRETSCISPRLAPITAASYPISSFIANTRLTCHGSSLGSTSFPACKQSGSSVMVDAKQLVRVCGTWSRANPFPHHASVSPLLRVMRLRDLNLCGRKQGFRSASPPTLITGAITPERWFFPTRKGPSFTWLSDGKAGSAGCSKSLRLHYPKRCLSYICGQIRAPDHAMIAS